MQVKRKLDLELPLPHAGQRQVLQQRRRFNAVTCGRRWGKTEGIGMGEALKMAIQKNKRVAWFAPSYKLLADVWREVCKLLYDAKLVRRRDSQEKRIELVTGSSLDFWTLDTPDAGRGRKYHRVIIDEAAMVKDLMKSWQAAILPTLADFQGDAWLLTTPKGYNEYYELTRLFDREDFGATWEMPTHTNPYILPSELALAREVMSEKHYRQEFEASFESLANRVVHAFDYVENTLPIWKAGAPHGELLVGMDFNVNPMTAVIGYPRLSMEEGDDEPREHIVIFDEIEIFDSGTEEMCQEIKARYPGRERDITVYPDPTGHSKGTAVPRETTNFTIIESYGYQLDVDDVPFFQDKANEINALSCNANGTRRLFVTKNCKKTISSLEQFSYKEGTSLPDKGKHDHLVDALCNIVHRRHPIDQGYFEEGEVIGL